MVEVRLQGNRLLLRLAGYTETTPTVETKFRVRYRTKGDYYPVNNSRRRITWTEYWVENVGCLGVATIGLVWVGAIADWISLPFRIPGTEEFTKAETNVKKLPPVKSPLDPTGKELMIFHPSHAGNEIPIVRRTFRGGRILMPLGELLAKANYELDRYSFLVRDMRSGKRLLHNQRLNLMRFEKSSRQVAQHMRKQQRTLLANIKSTLQEIRQKSWSHDHDSRVAFRLMVNLVGGMFRRYLRPHTPEMRRLKHSLRLWAESATAYNVRSTTSAVLLELSAAERSLGK